MITADPLIGINSSQLLADSSGRMMTTNLNIFDVSNYDNWKRRTRAAFEAKELSDFLDADPTPNEQLKGRKAYSNLLQLIGDDVLSTLQTETTAAKVWSALETQYGGTKGTVSQILTRKRLMTLKKTREVSMRQHLDTVTKLVSDLKSTGATVVEGDIIAYILMSLPKEYEGTRTALENIPVGILGMNVSLLRSRLLDAEALLQETRKETPARPAKCLGDTAAFAASNKNFFCTVCKKKDRSSNRITVSRNVTFNEKKNSISSPSLITTQNIEDSSESEQADAPEHTADPIVPPESETRRSTRTRKPVVKFPHPEVYAATNAEETFSYKELCERPTAEQRPWRKAMKEEINAMNENQVWELQHPPPGVKPITSKWIYKKKRDGVVFEVIVPDFP
ncbi:hypothetical protein JTE90_022068 [Oedothorax gibbosus]|uniref:Retrovirus-related Pol polyprotein from transposon TNT 1-94 n=1 Tax=Oedothorax gibbosus TaxID=931172 RepID=A0AAV6TXK5_9ARAC|nr:hypothetical protein JTE90_022068 [Oedothorax gibbosus]